MNNMIASVLLSIMTAFTALTMSGCQKSGPHESRNGIITSDNGKMRTSMTANEYAKEMGIGINLGNTLEAYWSGGNAAAGSAVVGGGSVKEYEKCWGACETTQEIIDGMRDAGFNTVRVPVYWGNGMADDGTFTITNELFDRVEEVINYCLNDGLYTVINIHHYDEYIIKNYSREDAVSITKNLWNQIAERYKEYSDYLVFEGFNENLGSQRESDNYSEQELFDYVNEMNQAFVDTVRATGGNNKDRLLIASGYWTNIDKTTTDNFIMPTDSAKNKMMVSVHYVDNAMYWTNQIGSQAWYDYSIAQCELLKKAFTDRGIPVFVGECTSIYEADRYAADAYVTDTADTLDIMMNMLSDYGFVPVLWDVNNNFYYRSVQIFPNEKDVEVVKEIAAKISGETEENAA